MVARTSSVRDRLAAEADVQGCMLEQAQATVMAQTDGVEPSQRMSPDKKIDLTISEGTENNVPPPAYCDVYGKIYGKQNGLESSASVSDDGRVNIRVNQLNRRLSQVFIPALRQTPETSQDSQQLPATSIATSLCEDYGSFPPPPLNIVIQVVGSRGDVQPFVALGKTLKEKYGHRVRLATHPTFQDFVEKNDLEFFSIGGDPAQLMAFMVKNPSLMPGFRSILDGDVKKRRRDVAEYIQGCWQSCYKTGNGIHEDNTLSNPDNINPEPTTKPFVADCIIANPPSFAHIHCAEKLGIPLHIMFTMPYSPTQAFPHPLANIQSSNADPQFANYMSYAMIEVLSWQGIGDIINRFRKKLLGLDPVSMIWAPGMLQRLKVPHTYCWSPALIPKPKDWSPQIAISGFYFLDQASNYTPPAELQAFLDTGPTPVYIGFGSIVLEDPNSMTELVFEAVRKTGQRVLLSKGWGGMGAEELRERTPEGVYMLGNVPHDWLFKHVSCVVHHGGAGTTAAGITAGRPTLVIPFFGDQPFWGAMVAKAGAGPEPIPRKQLTANKLADAILFCLRPESLQRANELAGKIATEQGRESGARSFHQHLEPDRLRCTLARSRCAVWHLRRTQVRLSAFAACTLANAALLDFKDLKPFRAQEYYTDEGPTDPISGPFMTACRAFGNMGMGLAELPTETFKSFRKTSDPGPQRPRASFPNKADEETTGNLEVDASMAARQYQHRNSPEIPGRKVPMSENSDDNRDMLRANVAHTSKGAGRFTKALVQSPMELSVSITKGFHNLPKLWGDDTVRPQERVSDFKSGVRAMGKEFGYGFYDGITGVVMQPWKGAQKEGTSGFFKGVGKGVGGLVTKPGAAMVGLLGHSMKGVHKEIQKSYNSNVDSRIIASRVAQGHMEWEQSSEAEKQDVIERWQRVQKYLKKRQTSDSVIQDILDAHPAVAQRISQGDTGESHSSLPGVEADESCYNAGEERCLTEARQCRHLNSSLHRASCDSSVVNQAGKDHVEQGFGFSKT